MIHCDKCGAKIDEDSTFCPDCGAKVKYKEEKEETKEEKKEKEHEEKKETKAKKKHIGEKNKIPIIIGAVLVVCALVVFGLPISYEATEEYTEKVPYEAQETYTEQEPYTVQVPRQVQEPYTATEMYTQSQQYSEQQCTTRNYVYAVDPPNGVATQEDRNCGFFTCDHYSVYTLTIKNQEGKLGTWKSKATYKGSLTGSVPKEEKSVTVYPNSQNTISWDQIINDGETVSWSGTSTSIPQTQDCKDVTKTRDVPQSRTVTKYRTTTVYDTETQYQDVTKTRTATKYNDVTKTRKVTKTTTLFNMWTGQTQWYYKTS